MTYVLTGASGRRSTDPTTPARAQRNELTPPPSSYLIGLAAQDGGSLSLGFLFVASHNPTLLVGEVRLAAGTQTDRHEAEKDAGSGNTRTRTTRTSPETKIGAGLYQAVVVVAVVFT